ncbi:MAG: NOL1/NOP2/sun family putative RNA methylase [Firmicutes bacterium]|nr:NOL1/NOP2/sun family putative RNA methylase [Bacillota bacterium]
MNLPKIFTNKFHKLMNNDEYENFIKSLEGHSVDGIRYNSNKLTEEEFYERIKSVSNKIPWTSDGYYFNKDESEVRLTIHPYYHQGLFYIQEPSAMFPAEFLDPSPGDKVLDLCAAPGGKSVQIACKMKNQGLLVSNEISPKRVKALKKNIELYGIKNTIITNSTGKNLFETYGTYFDKILVDAPCSGEGTFRKDKHSIKEYEKYATEELYAIQRDILDYAFKLLKIGGQLVYSTCTFSPEENEQQIEYMLDNYDCQLTTAKKSNGISDGRPMWAKSNNSELIKTVRFWPHKVIGEGHFVAKLTKLSGDEYKSKTLKIKWKPFKEINEKIKIFIDSYLNLNYDNYFYFVKDEEYYIMDDKYPFNEKNKIENIGIHLGLINKYNFIPSQSFAMTLNKSDFKNIIEVDFDNANKYLKGETLLFNRENGYYGIIYQNNILGWAKFNSGIFKNLYDKSWRKVSDGNSFDITK